MEHMGHLSKNSPSGVQHGNNHFHSRGERERERELEEKAEGLESKPSLFTALD